MVFNTKITFNHLQINYNRLYLYSLVRVYVILNSYVIERNK